MKNNDKEVQDSKTLTSTEVADGLINDLVQNQLIFAVFYCNASLNPKKIKLEPLKIKGAIGFQFTEFFDKKVGHYNKPLHDGKQAIIDCMNVGFQQITIRRVKEELLLKKSKQGWKMKTFIKEQKQPQWDHNRAKSYPLPEGKVSRSLVALKIMNNKGKVFDKGWNKFTQINRFLEIIIDVLPANLPQPFMISDFGCGKAYLSFALYEWLYFNKQSTIKLTGVDLNHELAAHNQQLADQLSFSGMRFQQGDIASLDEQKIHMALSLHACDTATDEAILKGVAMGASWIFAAPCCQHEFYDQLDHPLLKPLWKHGILREKVSSLLTDAFRSLYLEAMGYKVQVMEFIDARHSPKNILIRAVKTQETFSGKKLEACIRWAKELDVKPHILKEYFNRLP